MSCRPGRELSVPDICYTRMQEWAKQMVDSNATPIFSLGMSHDTHELHLYVPDNLESDDLALFLAYALSEIQKKAA